MTPFQIVALVLMAAVFAFWAFTVFRTLYALKAIADERRDEAGVGYFGSISITIGVFAEFFTKPEHRKQRRQVFGMTALMFAVILAEMFVLAPSG
jgi:MFS family permease